MNQKQFYRRHLPHIQTQGGLFFVTYSLKDSIPIGKLRAIQQDYELYKEHLDNKEEDVNRINFLKYRNYFQNMEDILAMNIRSPQYLSIKSIAELVASSLHFWEGKLMDLYCYCIMPNHVHTVFTLLNGEGNNQKSLSGLLQSIKRFSARESNKILNRQGQFWMNESYDYLVRNHEELRNIIQYVLDNPVKAGLCAERTEWKWSYIKEEYNEFM